MGAYSSNKYILSGTTFPIGSFCTWKRPKTKGQTKSKWFFQADVSSKKRTNEFYFTTMKPQVDLFSFVFWKKLKKPKRHFEINWPLQNSNMYIFSVIKKCDNWVPIFYSSPCPSYLIKAESVIMTFFSSEIYLFWIFEALLAPQRGSERKNEYGPRDNNNNQLLNNHIKLYIT